ncbi:DNA-binding response OmpR family regulator [Paenibacillus cellulosilyticus]|uniref:Heme response regulator HssR n=1 Tax=Paenibacillus cellulosilyticus TaxID=375489 RepID=A0A2V2YV71_9BACL|nr:response regulator transcription factor [Paenibacillus cellulosilyticus]PWW02932.1 DNA-binding response OmpR family regulator [Paenibacillus cellulosilyticus]QKS45840.1 response regulator transcription factor [Paenibacillus cellulosilyticus]
MKNLLVADDDPNIRALVRFVMTREGYQVHEAQDGAVAVGVMQQTSIDLAIIDVMMPKMDGLELCEYIREHYDIPIVMLTSKDQLSDKEQAYLRGTDDYVTKPFEPEELLFRIKALFRRYTRASSDIIRLNRITIDRKNVEVSDGQSVLLLPMREFELLAQLAQYPGRLFSREELIRLVWGADFEGDDRTVDVHIKRLRQRFANYVDDFSIQTVRGIGYKVEVRGK